MLIFVPSVSSRSLWRTVIRLKKYCSKVTSLLMRPGSQLQSIQCGGSSFPLDIFGFPSFLYVYGARPDYQSFLEGHFDHYDLYLICAQLVRGGIPPRIAFTFVSCPLSLEFEPFITIWSSSNYSCSRLRPKTQLQTPQQPIMVFFFISKSAMLKKKNIRSVSKKDTNKFLFEEKFRFTSNEDANPFLF